jgi:ATP-dependent Clp protease ATP-binding subunit ClpX
VRKLIAGPTVFICDECVELHGHYPRGEQVLAGEVARRHSDPEGNSQGSRRLRDRPGSRQEGALVAVHNHYKRLNHQTKHNDVELAKSNILLIARPAGKTLLAQTLARILDVPFTMADATTLTEAGYVGEDVENIILKLLQSADYNVERAQRASSISTRSTRFPASPTIPRSPATSRRGRAAVLKIMEGTIASVPPQGGRKHPSRSSCRSTPRISCSCAAAPSQGSKIISARGRSTSIGFGAKVMAPEDRGGRRDLPRRRARGSQSGLIPEFVGRLPVVATLEDLDEASLKLILTQPKNALVKQYQRLFEMESIDLTLAEEALGAIARKAIDRKTGARGLRSIMEGILLDTMFDLPSLEGVEEVVISREVVRGHGAAALYLCRPGGPDERSERVSRPHPQGSPQGPIRVETPGFGRLAALFA